jgi:hypothetical protein
MAKVVVDLTMSLDGFVAGPDDGPRKPLGGGAGPHIFDWYQGGDEVLHGDDASGRKARTARSSKRCSARPAPS